jgi:phage internal scaffolding protein
MAKTEPRFQSAYNRTARPTVDTGRGKTEQAHKNECDMNFILRDYARTGFIKHAKENQGKYDDISVQDFQDAMFIVAEAQNMFNELPGQVRKEFDHDPSRFLDFVQNPENKDKMAKLGILKGNDGLDLKGVPTNAPLAPEPAPPPAEPPADTPQPKG